MGNMDCKEIKQEVKLAYLDQVALPTSNDKSSWVNDFQSHNLVLSTTNDVPIYYRENKIMALTRNSPIWGPDQFVFTKKAITMLGLLSIHLKSHVFVVSVVQGYAPIDNNKFQSEDDFTKRLASFIAEDVSINTNGVGILIDVFIILCFFENFICDILNFVRNKYPNDDSTEFMLNGYPLLLISQITGLDIINSHILGESVKCVIESQKENNQNNQSLPDVLLTMAYNDTPLTGDDISPLTENELLAFQRYLNCSKSSYINIMLHSAYHLKSQTNDDNYVEILSPNKLFEIFQSPWLYLILQGITM